MRRGLWCGGVLRDQHASVHVLEVMIVSIMIVGAVLAVSQMNAHSGQDTQLITVHHDETETILENLKGLPSTNQSIGFTHRLEEKIVQYMRGDNTDLDDYFRTRGPGDPHRFLFQQEDNQTVVIGPQESPRTVPSTGSVDWVSLLGTTIIQPSLSHHTPNTPIHVQALPTWINRIPLASQNHYQVTLTLEIDDPDTSQPKTHTHTTHHPYRMPHRDQNPLMIQFIQDDEVRHHQALTHQPGLFDPLNHTWQVNTRLQGTPGANGTWLTNLETLRVHIPPGWALMDSHEIGPWAVLEDSTPRLQRLSYHGPPLRGLETAWLNFTLQHESIKPPLHPQALHVQQERRTWSQATLLLSPPIVAHQAHQMPITLYASQPNPLPYKQHSMSEIRFTVQNPSPHEATLTGFQVQFPEGFRVQGQGGPWNHHYEGWPDPRVYNLSDTITLQGHEATDIVLPIQARQLDGDQKPQPLPPVLDFTGPAGATDVATVLQGPLGIYEAWLPPATTGLPGDYAIKAHPNEVYQVPRGSGAYTYQVVADPVIERLQQARSTMQVETSPFRAALDDPLLVTIDTGELFGVLRELPTLSEDRVKVKIEAGSLFSHLIDHPDAALVFDMDLAWGTEVVGTMWTPGGDLLVAYADGHLVRLGGSALPEEASWRKRVSQHLSAGPFLLEDQVVAFSGMQGVSSRMLVLDGAGELLSHRSVPGLVHEALPHDCVPGGPGVGYLLLDPNTKMHDGTYSMDPGSGLDLDPDGAKRVRTVVGAANLDREFEHRLGDVFPMGFDVGRFGPDEDCSLVVAFQESIDGVGRVVRVGLDSGQVWDLEVPGGVTGAFTLRGEDGEADRLVVMQREGGWFVSDGVVQEQAYKAHRVMSDLLGLELGSGLGLEGDLVGLSWVNATMGYTASTTGHVFRTLDGGLSWTEVTQGSGIVEGTALLEDFAFGGNGRGVFLDDDGRVRIFDPVTGFAGWWWEDYGVETVLGLVETDDEPAVLGVRPQWEETGIYTWNPGNNRFSGTPIVSAPCLCETGGVGNQFAMAVWDEKTLFVNTTEGNAWTTGLNAATYAVDATGTALSLQHGDDGYHLVWQNGEVIQSLELDEEWVSGFDSSGKIRAGRDPTSAYLLYEDQGSAGLFMLQEGEILHRAGPSGPGAALSSGPGPLWWVKSGSLEPVSLPDTYIFEVKSDFLDNQMLELEFSELPDGARWRILGTHEAWKSGGSLDVDWEPGMMIEVQFREDPTIALLDPDLRLEVRLPDQSMRELGLSYDVDCEECLIANTPSQFFVGNQHRWGPSNGLMPSHGVSLSGAVLAHAEDGIGYMVGRSGESYWSHHIGIGVPWKELDLPEDLLADENGHHFLPVRLPGGRDVVLGETRQSLAPDLGGLKLVGSELESKTYRVDPSTGVVSCVQSASLDGGLGMQHAQHHPNQDLFVLGSLWGRLTALQSSGCGELWSHAGLELGSRLNLVVPPENREWKKGPVVITVEITIELESGEPVSLYFMDAAWRSRSHEGVEVVVYRSHLHYWWWEEDVYFQSEPRQPSD
jgi:hypothetical protein